MQSSFTLFITFLAIFHICLNLHFLPSAYEWINKLNICNNMDNNRCFWSASLWDLTHMKDKSVVWVEPMLGDPKSLGKRPYCWKKQLIQNEASFMNRLELEDLIFFTLGVKMHKWAKGAQSVKNENTAINRQINQSISSLWELTLLKARYRYHKRASIPQIYFCRLQVRIKELCE